MAPDTGPEQGWRSCRPVRKLRICAAGLLVAVRADRSVAYKSALSVASLSLCVAYRELIDFLVVLVVTAVMLVAELMNTAIEQLCDTIEASHNDQIGRIKDIAAAAAGIAGLAWAVVVAVEAGRVLTQR